MARISDLMLEQYRLGELSAAQQRVVREELSRNEVLRGRLSSIEKSDEDIRASYPSERVVPLIREKAQGRRGGGGRTARTLAWAIPAAAVVVILLSLPLVLRTTDATRLKGAAPHLLVFRKTAAGAEELRPGAVAAKGDVLQLSYAAAEARYGVIFSIDGRGAVTWHVPAGYSGGSRPAPLLESKGPVVLPSAYELDDAPRFERFFFVYASAPFDVSEVERSAHAPASGDRGTLTLPRGVGQFSLLVKKPG